MLDKFFGFLKVQDELSILESIIEHNRIDEEELGLLTQMVEFLCENTLDKVEEYYFKIRKISQESEKGFEMITEQIVQAHFDYQKQYDLLRLHRRIENISGLIIATAKRVLIINKIGATLPEETHDCIREFVKGLNEIHTLLKSTIEGYSKGRKGLIKDIEKISQTEHHLDHIRSICLETLYALANEGKLKMGTLRAIENLVEHIEDISDAIEEAGTSLEWLLIY